METALISGANKSIGLMTARELLRHGHRVFLGSRDLTRGEEAARTLREEGLDAVEVIELDVTSDLSVQHARARIGERTDALDVLVNNAGISGGRPQTASESRIEAYQEVFDVNLFGVVRLTQAFLDLMRGSANPRIVNVSSSVGSLTLHNDPSWQYFENKGPSTTPRRPRSTCGRSTSPTSCATPPSR